MSQCKSKVREFLGKHFRNHELSDDQDIFALGFVNSLLAIQLVNFIEKEFAVAVEDEDLDLDNFRSLNAIDALVARKSVGA